MTILRIGVTLPGVGKLQAMGPGGLATAACHAERLGFESVWVPDLINGEGKAALEPTVTQAVVAGSTERVGLGFCVLVLPLRPIALVAAQIAGLQYLSGNRVILGVGSGGFPTKSFWQAAGVSETQRGRKIEGALDVLPNLIAGNPTRLRYESAQPMVTLAPAVVVPPILIGGNSEVAIRRAAAHDHAWFPSLVTPEMVARGAGYLRELSTKSKQKAPGITVGTHIIVGEDRSARETFIRNFTGNHGRAAEEAATVLITGSKEQVAERVSAYAAAGGDRLVMIPGGEDWMRHCELIAEACSLLG